ncbi:helix-turn-helix domain-containing protein [Chryseobacterium sp. JJR-5R]|uniref:helix-turn-helix domain-containing protein n=1 Tax=Chryseobacterium sp. JJR-5R TaxID=3093923 RepID=UPI002A757071|nr:helix-turn-helix domain-containing protein [Chryseobacterium sp. JJR-5R]WPO84175.1 helix-turn-helix domain-containing protein [Chryseobacterium sp. JJR-5R]
MGIKDRRNREKEHIKNLIIDAARKISIEKSMAQVTIRKIAKEIHYSTTIIYYYFKNKEEIISILAETDIKK